MSQRPTDHAARGIGALILACCGFGPVLMVDDDFYEKVDPAKVGDVLAKYQ